MSENNNANDTNKQYLLGLLNSLVQKDLNQGLQQHAYRTPQVTDQVSPLYSRTSAATLFAGSAALYYQTTYQRVPSKLRFLTFAAISAYVSQSLAASFFETPIQTAQRQNYEKEYRHQLYLSILKNGKSVQHESQKRQKDLAQKYDQAVNQVTQDFKSIKNSNPQNSEPEETPSNIFNQAQIAPKEEHQSNNQKDLIGGQSDVSTSDYVTE